MRLVLLFIAVVSLCVPAFAEGSLLNSLIVLGILTGFIPILCIALVIGVIAAIIKAVTSSIAGNKAYRDSNRVQKFDPELNAEFLKDYYINKSKKF